ncbi:RHS repeat-associated core domain-containing protein [Chromatiaceae bacterium AAb-1]|nr:RHS repeat-associated core domain-containing protein [Chromatiaceae bacterium AAb-1]
MNREFTGHQQVDHASIIHMGGRIYDAHIGRFLQADPFVQAPGNSQSLNRYSYVLNNPLSYTDPSGYFFKSIGKFVKKYWKVIVAVAVTYFTAGAASGWAAGWGFAAGTMGNAVAAGAIAGAAGGATAGFLQSGNLKGAVRGAFSGAIAGAAGGYANFGSLGGVGDAVKRIGVAALGGCGAGKASGGDCRKGAQTAALMQSMTVGMEAYSKYKPTWKTAEVEGVVKFKGDGVENSGVSNVGKSIEVIKGEGADHLVGRSLSSLTPEEAQLLLRNEENIGKLFIKDGSVRFSRVSEGSRPFTAIAKNAPGMNSMAVFHDVWMANWNAQNAILLGATIIPAMYVNYTALGVGHYGYLYDSLGD